LDSGLEASWNGPCQEDLRIPNAPTGQPSVECHAGAGEGLDIDVTDESGHMRIIRSPNPGSH
jgi:hypothetical protein